MYNKDKKYLEILQKDNMAFYNAAVTLLEADKSPNTIYKTSILAVAPILFTYIYWVIEEARKNQIKRLYFLARDGYIMKRIAAIICEQNGYDIECRYLYCSRIAWRIPQYHLEKDKCLDKICINSVDVNLEKILERANLSEIEKDNIFNLLSINQEERKKHLQYYEVLQYKEKLSKCEPFLQYVYHHSEDAYETATGYLNQEGLFDNVRYALVDTGWTGSMQTSLSCLLNGRKIEGFYFGMYNLPKEADWSDFHTFFFSKNTNMKNKVYFNNNLFECLCSAPDGMTVGYAKSEGGYIPVFSSDVNVNTGVWDLDMHINTVLEFTRLAIRQENISFNYNTSQKLVYKLCKHFMVYPSINEARCYGNFRFSDDITEKDINILAADMTKEEIEQNFLLWRIANRLKLSKFNTPYKQSCWIDASITKCQGINNKKYIRHILLFRWVQYLSMRILRNY